MLLFPGGRALAGKAGDGPALMPPRAPALVTQALGQELLVYDAGQGQAHCLNEEATRLLLRCDGTTLRTEAAAALHPDHEPQRAVELLELGLSILSKARLVEGPRLSRRSFLRRCAGLAAVLPVVTSVAVPLPAAAASCIQLGGTDCRVAPCCNADRCRNGVCCNTTGSPCNRNQDCCQNWRRCRSGRCCLRNGRFCTNNNQCCSGNCRNRSC